MITAVIMENHQRTLTVREPRDVSAPVNFNRALFWESKSLEFGWCYLGISNCGEIPAPREASLNVAARIHLQPRLSRGFDVALQVFEVAMGILPEER